MNCIDNKKKPLNRRELLKVGGGLLVAGATVGCGDGMNVVERNGAPTVTDSAHDTFDTGSVPVETSGWTRTQGVGAQYPALEQSLDTDVLVIGAGLAGSSLALHLSELGINTVVLETHQPGWGASGRNAGHVLPLLRDMSVFESFPDQGKAFFELFREHHTIPFDIAAKYSIECDAEQSGYLNAMTSQAAFEKFKSGALPPAEKLGQKLVDVDVATMRNMTGSEYYSHGLLYPSGGRVNPYLFTQGMIKAAVEQGARVFGDTQAVKLTADGKGWRVEVANGSSVRCQRVVFCTNAYTTDIVPEFARSCYPLTAYALSTEPLAAELLDRLMPSRATLAQVPIDLNPFLIDGHNRIVTASLPSRSDPANAQWHFQQHLNWIHRTWPESKDFSIKLETYWTGRVAMRDQEFPGMYELSPGVYGLMHFNAWGNVMAPMMAMALAKTIATDRPDQLPFPMVQPDHIQSPGKQEFIIRSLMIPAARIGQKLGII